ncbi:hypothetical protein D0809_21565 [Flavobacterium circumlabens]|uniref:Uncharacterized protein n=1 Tax=Flavobacterium circumlabens TaxID=2133765 RepID=A0A4Y7U7D2_9FLAO|nr:hypothetical protein [Flavobacterium circumlabens]TCN61291.1 hypothetical protein EV142_101880 [Flavobacterium circumlabens]TEB42164.1 hypothetical protein D0809_21565 [Flavobacterium circumlabens]
MTAKDLINEAVSIQKIDYKNPSVIPIYEKAIELSTTKDDEYDKLYSYYSIMFVCSHLLNDYLPKGIEAANTCLELLKPYIAAGNIWHYTEWGKFQKEVIRYANNFIAWQRYENTDDEKLLHEALKMTETACHYIEDGNKDQLYLYDTRARLLLKLNRKEEAYEIIRTTLIKDKNNPYFEELLNDPDYKIWLKNRNEEILQTLSDDDYNFLERANAITKKIKARITEDEKKPAVLIENNLKVEIIDGYEAMDKYGFLDSDIPDVGEILMITGDVFLNHRLDSEWLLAQTESLDVDEIEMAFLIVGNVTLEGADLWDDDYMTLLITGDVKCDILYSENAWIVISGDVDAKYGIIGEYNDGVLQIDGKTKAPYIFNDDEHDMRLDMKGKHMEILGYSDHFLIDGYGDRHRREHLLRPEVWDEEDGDEFVRNFFEIVKKGESPFITIKKE